MRNNWDHSEVQRSQCTTHRSADWPAHRVTTAIRTRNVSASLESGSVPCAVDPGSLGKCPSGWCHRRPRLPVEIHTGGTGVSCLHRTRVGGAHGPRQPFVLLYVLQVQQGPQTWAATPRWGSRFRGGGAWQGGLRAGLQVWVPPGVSMS